MGGGDDEPVVDERSAAEEQPVQSYGRLPRVFAQDRVVAADDSSVFAAATATVQELRSLFFGRCPAMAMAAAADV